MEQKFDTIKMLGIGESLGEKRLKICKKCKLYLNKYGGMCNNKLWINPQTEETSDSPKKGFIPGCGCILPAKVNRPISSCVLDKW